MNNDVMMGQVLQKVGMRSKCGYKKGRQVGITYRSLFVGKKSDVS